MNVQLLERFVTKSAQDSGHPFTLDGERVTPGDLGDPKCLLPLVVAAIQNIYGEVRGTRANLTACLQPANPQTHMLGWEINKLPDMPEGAVLLFANYAVREHLAQAPQPKLTFAPLQGLPAKTTVSCELRPHLSMLGLHAQPAPDRGHDTLSR